MNSNPVLFCFAMKEEAVFFRQWAKDRSGICILLTGIGQKNSESSAKEFLAERKPKSVFTCGFAGGLNPDLALGTVVFSTEDKVLADTLAAAGARLGRFFCASRIATTVAEKQELRRTTGADAVEMESDVIQADCRERGIPCATVRVISDTANEALPLDFNKLSKADLSLDFGKLAVAVLKNPAKIAALLRLQQNCRFAAQRLAEVLEKIVSS